MSKCRIILINAGGIVLCVAAVICILYLPFIYLNWSNKEMFNKTYPMNKIDVKLESDVADIEMVSRLHAIIGSYYEISSTNDYFTPEDGDYAEFSDYINSYLHVSSILNQIDVMMSKPALQKVYGSYFENNKQVPMSVNVFYLRNNQTGVSDVCNIIYAYEEYNVNIIYDSKTDKIVELSVSDFRKKKHDATLKERKKAAKAMIEYLNLEIVGDFECKWAKYSSKKAHIAISCNKENDAIRLYASIDDKYEISNYGTVGKSLYNDESELKPELWHKESEMY